MAHVISAVAALSVIGLAPNVNAQALTRVLSGESCSDQKSCDLCTPAIDEDGDWCQWVVNDNSDGADPFCEKYNTGATYLIDSGNQYTIGSNPSKIEYAGWSANVDGLITTYTDQVAFFDDDKGEIVSNAGKVFLRQYDPLDIKVYVKPAECKDVDLYYLMDLSQSMADDLAEVKAAAKSIAGFVECLAKAGSFQASNLDIDEFLLDEGLCPYITGGSAQCGTPSSCNQASCDAKYAFGSVTDKPMSPFGYWSRSDESKVLQPGYPFYPNFIIADDGVVNHVWKPFPKTGPSFTVDKDEFETFVDSASVNENIDHPEAYTEAAVQIASCSTKVGWSPFESFQVQARRLLMYVSDADFHVAGDGARAGIYTPNPAKCYFQDAAAPSFEEEINRMSTMVDYPSVGQLRDVLFDKEIAPVFSITQTTIAGQADNALVYSNLVDNVFGFGQYQELVKNAGTGATKRILETIRDAYVSVADDLVLRPKVTGYEWLVRSIFVEGTTDKSVLISSQPAGTIFAFDVQLEWRGEVFESTVEGVGLAQEVEIGALGFGSTTIVVEVQPDWCELCSANVGGVLASGSFCDVVGGGAYTCGLCLPCNENYSGRDCACQDGVFSGCQALGVGAFCSGRGFCECNQCVCETDENGIPLFTGDLCECPTSCPNDCSNRGVCILVGAKCGTCDCEGTGYNGFDCSCRSDACTEDSECSALGSNGVCVEVNVPGCDPFKDCACAPGFTIGDGGQCDCEIGPCAPFNGDGEECYKDLNPLNECKCAQCECAEEGMTSDCKCKASLCDPNPCLNGGVCDCGECTCPPGYVNEQGGICECRECPNDCNGNGECECGVCKCFAGWTGPLCLTECPQNIELCAGYSADNDPSDYCSGNGSCSVDTCSQCECFDGYESDPAIELITGKKDCNCLVGLCPGATGDCSAANGNGVCRCGECTCNDGFVFPDDGCSCEVDLESCPKGVARGDTTNILQVCSGASQGSCESREDGRFNCNTCYCEPGWEGAACDCPVDDPCPIAEVSVTVEVNGVETTELQEKRCGNGCCGTFGAGDVCEEGGCKCTCEEGWEAPLVLEDQFRNSDGFFDTRNGYREGACICDKSLTCPVDALTEQECGPWGTCTCGNLCECERGWSKDNKGLCTICDPEFGQGLVCPPDVCADKLCTDCVDYEERNTFTGELLFECAYCKTERVCGWDRTLACADEDLVEDAENCVETLKVEEFIALGLGILFGLIAIAVLAFILYKLWTRRADKREWKKFEQNRKDAAWKTDANPLFKSSVSEHSNPLYSTTKTDDTGIKDFSEEAEEIK